MSNFKYSIFNNGLCLNNIVLDEQSEWQPPENCILVPGTYKIGKIYTFDEQSNQWIDINFNSSPSREELLSKCNYRGFWDGLLISQVYQTIRTQASTDLNVNLCCTEFIAAISDAKSGYANPDAIQTCIDLFMNAVTLNESEISEIQTLLKTYGMSDVYKLP